MGIARKKVTYDKGAETRNPNPDRGATSLHKPAGSSLAGSKAASRARSLGDARRKANRKGANLAYGDREGRLSSFATTKRQSDADLGAQKAATDFGEWDEDTPTIWKHKEYTGDYNTGSGTNGALYEFEGTAEGTGSGSTGLDSSGNSNNINFRNHNGGLTDTPTNNFCVMNMSFKDDINNTATYKLTSGLTKLTVPSATSVAWGPLPATFQLSSGKWYWEMKWDSGTTFLVGVMNSDADISSIWTYCTMYRPSNGYKYIDNVITSYGSSQSTGDIIGIALDLDNETLQAYVNNSSEGAAFGLGTTTKARGYYVPIVWYGDTGASSMNFGGHTAMSISSAETDENGYGAFEYAPPSGFYALCTKNLAELG